MKQLAHALTALILLLPGASVWAAQARSEDIRFAPGASGAVIKGQIHGYETINYRVRAAAGQKLQVKMESDNGASYFNIYAPGTGPGDRAMFIGTLNGRAHTSTLPADGIYTIQVFMMRSAARRNENAIFTLHLQIDPRRDSAPGKSKSPRRSRSRERLATAAPHLFGQSGG